MSHIPFFVTFWLRFLILSIWIHVPTLAFKKTNLEHSNYGKSNGINPEKWWSLVIRRSFENSGIPKSGLEPLTRDMFLHVGDDFKEDYEGALASGIQSVLLCRPKDGQEASDHQLDRSQWISSLRELSKMC
ncbi:uncharacterized protein MELLADRAFT_105012 [Melampsora larici-populina 98AG31]|uniref:Uncharacterized protein n=1 Tax=Melampsora larici-populina (strain 98AG31 / pathotype 3-4-7) TaxID=747676 RepID=F4RGN3_MELLP|nr:uncharacterized protein MELLADRAFT_105012 [Melampsora larici-populina 98AG31]EGG08563.1 hypothetical protein MELLADRAFT_105012 [Melampsora larici-populina 98AG31]